MAEVINMPLLSDTMEEGTIAKWLKKKGDKVEEGDILAEIETDKATMEFESFYEGTLLHIAVEEGDSAPVNQMIAIIGEEGEDIQNLIAGKTSDSSKKEKDSEGDSSKEKGEEEKKTRKKRKRKTKERKRKMPPPAIFQKMLKLLPCHSFPIPWKRVLLPVG